MSRFIVVDRDTAYLPPSVNEWLPSDHLARFVVEVIEQLDLSALTRQYGGRGSAAYHPAVLLGLLIYGYASGVHSSRKIERATYDSVAFRFVAANTHPDHDTLATFRRHFLKEVEAQLRQEVQTLLALAESSDAQTVPDGMDVSAEIARREDRLGAIAQAKAKMTRRKSQPMRARSRAARTPSCQRLAPRTATKSTSRMSSRVSCLSRAGASRKATTRKLASTSRR
jgi:transposase